MMPRNRAIPVFVFLTLTAFTVLLLSCTQQTDPETVALAFINQVESAVEDQSIKGIQNLISDTYHDEFNRDQLDLQGLATLYLFRSKSIHLFIDLKSVQSLSDSSITCRLLVAFAATPIDRKSLLPRINADCYWFDIELVEEKGDWKIVSAVWQQAMLDDFFSDEPTDPS